MKLYYFNPNDWGEEFIVMAESKIDAHAHLLNHFRNKISNPLYDSEISWYTEKLEIWENVNPLDKSTYPPNYSIDEYEKGSVIETEIS
jgi:hypothetical protein